MDTVLTRSRPSSFNLVASRQGSHRRNTTAVTSRQSQPHPHPRYILQNIHASKRPLGVRRSNKLLTQQQVSRKAPLFTPTPEGLRNGFLGQTSGTAMASGDAPLHVARSAIPLVQPVLDAFSQQPASWQSSLIVTTAVFVLGYPGLASGLSVPGIAAAYLLGLVVWRAFGFEGFLTVCLYFAIGTIVTKVKMKQKESEGIAEKRKGRRGPASVVGSGFAGALCSIAAVALGANSASVDGATWMYKLLQLGFAASFCTKLSDTTSSEIGKAYGRSTYLVTTFEAVPRGTEGAISLEGTAAGLLAAVVLASAAFATGEVSAVGALICVFASQVANFGESYIGATLQDRPGFEWMNNDVVNVLNILTGAGLAIALGSLIPL